MNIINLRNTYIKEEDVEAIFTKGGLEGIKPNNIGYYQTAFSHTSYVKEEDYSFIFDLLKIDKDKYVNFQNTSYQRYEFAGDSIVNSIIAIYLYDRYGEQQEGFLTKLKIKLISKEFLSKFARHLGFNKYLLLSNHMENTNGRNKNNVLEDSFEAFIFAMKLDGLSLDTIEKFVINVMEDCVNFSKLIFNNDNYKDRVKKYTQKYNKKLEFTILTELGSAASRSYIVSCVIDGKMMATGFGKSKKNAEHQASLKTLIKLGEISLEEHIFINNNK